MARRRSSDKTPAELYRAPIITERLIVREATRGDAKSIERTMEVAGLDIGHRTSDGARRFGAGLAEVPVWSATRAVCEKGSARIVGGLVLSEVDDPSQDVRRIGWWLEPGAERYAPELLAGAEERLRALGADRVVMHVRADDDDALRTVGDAGFRRGDAVQHTNAAGQPLDFWEYVRP